MEIAGALISQDWIVDWREFYAVSAIFQPYNGGIDLETPF